MWKHKRWFVGVVDDHHAEIFKASELPTESTHGSTYRYCYGDYTTRERALQVAEYVTRGIVRTV